MSPYVDELEGLLDDVDDFGEFEERVRRSSVRTPSGRSSFQARQAPTAASQSQVQAAARNLDVKIETLSAAVKAVESRTNALAAESEKTRAAFRKEIMDRRKAGDVTRNDLQQTKMLAVLLPLLTQGETVTVQDESGKEFKVATQSDSQLASLLPILLLFGTGSGGYGSGDSKGGLGDPIMLILLVTLLGKK
jgi:hypothetical protein